LSIFSKNEKFLYNPCSYYNGHFKSDSKFALNEVWNGPEHLNLKNNIENDIPIVGCQSCYNEEKFGLVSRRMGAKTAQEDFFKNTNIELDSPTSIDYSVGNLCNLKCVICDPSNSSSWMSDWKKLYPAQDMSSFKFDKFNQFEVTDVELLKNINSVHFHGGGEPLLSSNHVNLLKAIKQAKGLNDVRVFYNTNGTVRVPDDIIELWGECRLLELYFSIDDIGERFDYQRTGAKWKEVEKNLEWYKKTLPPNHLFKINCTWGYLNLFNLDHLVDWYSNNFNENRLADPTELIFQKAIGVCGITSASNKIIDLLLEKFEDYPQLTMLVKTLKIDNSTNHANFFSFIEKLDAIRNKSFSKICPEWAQMLTKTN
jgi:organic radical activating enzyme